MWKVIVIAAILLVIIAVLLGCGASAPAPTVTPRVHADFNGEILSEPTDRIKWVQFTDLSTGPVKQWEWDIDGDGYTDSTDQDPMARYAENGLYTITLTVRGPLPSDVDTMVKVEYIEIVGCPT